MDAPDEHDLGSPSGHDEWPDVSVIMPVRNEEPYLRRAVERILADDYRGRIEVALAVGPSTDDTERIAAQLAAEHPEIIVVDNPTGRTPEGLNAAIAATVHPVVVRVDGHGFLPRGYMARAVEELRRTGAANVGGVMVPQGETAFEQAVARAMSSYLGMGGAEFHVGGEAGPVQSVYLGVFRREVLERLGGFDEHFTRAQDWELNHRIREAGEVVWFVPDLRVAYRPRSTFRALARQFHESGRWRREMVTYYPETAAWRYLAPPVAFAGVVAGAFTTAVGHLGGPRRLRGAWSLPVGYAGVVLLGSAIEGRGLPWAVRWRLPAVVACMHMTWGAGFLRGTRTWRRERTGSST